MIAKLSATSAVAAVLVTERDEYLLQLRDDKPEIWFPGYWGLFGGSVDGGETPEQALCRELGEEIGYRPSTFSRFTNFTFDFAFTGQGTLYRTFYEVPLPSQHVSRLVLGEGQDMRLFTAEEALALPRLVPYDAFALYLHVNRRRLT